MRMRTRFLGMLMVLIYAGCATMPTGPSVMVLPSVGKPFDQFKMEDFTCRQWASQQIGLTPQDTANQNTATGAVVGTAIGAGAGALLGAASGHPGVGAAIGAGSGLLVGTAAGASSGQVSGYEAQRRYDNAYVQCMYSNGNQVPSVVRSPRRYYRAVPPPPPGY
jgi:OmpA family protein